MLVPFLKKVEYASVGFFPWIRIIFQWNNGCCLFSRCMYSTMNHAMCLSLCPYHNIFCKKLVELFYHYDTVDSGSVLQVVADYTRNRVVLEITNYDLLFFTEMICFCNYYTLANEWHMKTGCRPGTNNFKGILF